MFFAFVFVLNLFVYGQCHLVAKNVGEKRAMPAWNCLNAVNPNAAAPAIRNDIVEAIKRRKVYKRLADSQFAWLYLQGTANSVVFDNADVSKVLSPDSKVAFPFVDDIWPVDPTKSNFLFGALSRDARGKGPDENTGHPEHRILEYLGNMRQGFQARNSKNCPCFVILSSTRDPCNDEKGSGCAYDYIAKKDVFVKSCPNTKFYLHVHRTPSKRYVASWEATKKLMTANDIGIITDFLGRLYSTLQ